MLILWIKKTHTNLDFHYKDKKRARLGPFFLSELYQLGLSSFLKDKECDTKSEKN